MTKRATLLLAFFLCCGTSYAEVKVRPVDHMQNKSPGRCAWCALETLGRTHGWGEAAGMVENNARTAHWPDMVAELNKLKIKHHASYPGHLKDYYYVIRDNFNGKPYSFAVRETKAEAEAVLRKSKLLGRWWVEKHPRWDTGVLKKAVADDLGAAVDLIGKFEKHMVVVVDIDDDEVRMIDSNTKQGEITVMSMPMFLSRWNGFAIVLDKK